MCIRAPRPLIRLESASFSFGSLTRVVRSFVLEEDAPKRTLISGIVTELPRIKKWQSDRGRENEKEKEREGFTLLPFQKINVQRWKRRNRPAIFP